MWPNHAIMLIHGKVDFGAIMGGVQHESHHLLDIISPGKRYYKRIIGSWLFTQNTLHNQPQRGHTKRHGPYDGQDCILTIHRARPVFIGETSC